jgi:hypothetical protein
LDKVALEASLRSLDLWLIGFGIFVAVGVVGESIAGFLHWRRGGQLQAVQVAENLALQKAISDANARAIEAQLALEKFKAPRTLSPEQQRRIASKLLAFEGTTFELITYRAEPEPASLAESIGAAVKNAKWSLIPVDGSMLGVASGVFVTVNKTTCDESGRCTEAVLKRDRDAAEALVTALRNEGIVSALTTPGNLRINPRVAVQIHVGLKPQ